MRGFSHLFENKKATEYVLYGILFSRIRTPCLNVQSNTEYDFRLEDVANLPGTILLLIVVQTYEFQEKSEKLKKTKLWITTENRKK